MFCFYFLSAGKGYAGALITFWLNIALLWVNTIIGMLWEKDMYGHYFMCREFFWEDAGNLAALIAYNSYVAALWLNWSQHDTALLMLVANSVYLINFGQFVFKLNAGPKTAAIIPGLIWILLLSLPVELWIDAVSVNHEK